MKKILSLAIVLFLALSTFSFADIGCKVNGDSTQCGPFTNIDFKAPAGSDISTITGMTRSIPVVGSTMFATGIANGGAVSAASTTAAVPVGYGYVRKVIPSNSDPLYTAGTLAPGKPGQLLYVYVTNILPANSTGSYTITPTVSYGWTSIKFTVVGDHATFLWLDSTNGWALVDAVGTVTVTYK